ncbi:MAG TPA: hypothetical protein VIE88_13330 [Vicinamibacteria bacterium]|jgi:hypothetical protein
MNRTLLAAFLALPFGALPLQALPAQTPWIHVEVDENDTDASHVKVNLPLSVVEIALEAAPDNILEEGRIHVHSEKDLDVEDLRRMWNELRSAPESELVSVEEKERTLSIRREKDEILIDVDDRDDGDKVHIQVPVSVVDALFSGEGKELNLKGAISALKSLRGDVVRVDGDDAKVRIWIDEKD